MANPPGGGTSTLQVGLYHAQGNGVSTQSPTWTTPISGHGQQSDICFPSYYQLQVLIYTAGWTGHAHTDTHTSVVFSLINTYVYGTHV